MPKGFARRLPLGFLLLISGFLGVRPLDAAPKAREPAIPPGVTNAFARDIARDVPVSGLRKVHVLATLLKEDDRPWRVESALVLYELTRNRWELLYLSRNPKLDKPRSAWVPHSVMDSTQRPWKYFDHRPTASDVAEFLKLSEWTFAADPPFRLLRGEVFPSTWKTVLGFECPYTFPKP